jgi:hypothetical protein
MLNGVCHEKWKPVQKLMVRINRVELVCVEDFEGADVAKQAGGGTP